MHFVPIAARNNSRGYGNRLISFVGALLGAIFLASSLDVNRPKQQVLEGESNFAGFDVNGHSDASTRRYVGNLRYSETEGTDSNHREPGIIHLIPQQPAIFQAEDNSLESGMILENSYPKVLANFIQFI